MSVLVEYPIEEAEAVLSFLEPDATGFVDLASLESGRQRLRQAVLVERGLGGDHELDGLEDLAKALLGERVNVRTTYGSNLVGTLERIVGFRSLLIRDDFVRRPVNLSLVDSIELEPAA